MQVFIKRGSARACGLTTQSDKKELKKWKPETTIKTGRNPNSQKSRQTKKY
jgi:hypothetical protein